jgi:glycosyltransferase involved in cell wall biosynthesis
MPDPRLAALLRLAIVPAYNEEGSVGGVIDEIRAFDPGFEVVVVDDGSVDRTSAVAAGHGARVLRLPFNLGIGGAMQTGFRFAFEGGFDLAVQIDGDGQHDPAQLPAILGPVLDGEADMVVGSRFAGADSYRPPVSRRIGIRVFAGTVSLLAGQKVTDATSGFRAVNRRGIALFAADYPHDYPEVEATLMLVRHRLRLREVPVTMRERTAGRSSIGAFASVYYMAKVLLGLFVGLFRKNVVPLEEQ